MNVADARDTLLRLLTRPEDRATLASAAEREPALRTVDPEQLERTAKLLRRDIVRRRRRGAGSLLEQFTKTLEGSDEEHITASFVRSRHFQDYDELPHGTLGLCAEEAFFRFLEDEGIGNPTIRRTEYLRAAALVLTVHDHPAFSIPRPFVAVGGGYVAIAPGPHLFASVAGRFIRGPIPQSWRVFSPLEGTVQRAKIRRYGTRQRAASANSASCSNLTKTAFRLITAEP